MGHAAGVGVTTSSPRLRLAVALEGAGWHPAAWREDDARPDALFTARYWRELLHEAELGSLDFATFPDAFRLQDGDRRVVRGRLDAVLVAAAVAPRTTGIGLVPTVTATHTEPFHISKAVASLDYAATGRAGQLVRVSAYDDEFAHVGRRVRPSTDDLLREAADHIDVVRRLWDSWEDRAEIRDAATGRFVDRGKLHYVDFHGRWFAVKGPSITPRPPQGNPPVLTRARTDVEIQFAARNADVTVLPAVADNAVHQGFGELVVLLESSTRRARQRRARLDEWHWAASDVPVFVGTPGDLAEHLITLNRAGFSGFELHPGALPHDLKAITRELVPLLQKSGVVRRGYAESTLRARLGLKPAVNRYAKASVR